MCLVLRLENGCTFCFWIGVCEGLVMEVAGKGGLWEF